MNTFEYFEGKRELADRCWSEKYGKVEVSYSVTEEWERMKGRSIGCNEQINLKFKRRSGIKSSYKYELTSMLKGSLGQKGIAQFESQLSAKVGIEVTTEDYIEDEEELPIKAPECLRKNIIIYQLVNRHVFIIRDERFFNFNKGEQKLELKEYADFIWTSTPTVPDPDCDGCEDIDNNDGVINLILNNLGITSGFNNSDNGLYVEALDLELGHDVIENTNQVHSSLSVNDIPEYLSYIARFDQKKVDLYIQSVDYVSSNIHTPTVMIVDDSAVMRATIQRSLSRHGISVMTAIDGVDALAQLRISKPDIMFVDIEMPNMNGYELVKKVIGESDTYNIEIFMISPTPNEELKVKALNLGVKDFLTKPLLLENLSKILTKNVVDKS
jgi:CheY-like chemotaxis protein